MKATIENVHIHKRHFQPELTLCRQFKRRAGDMDIDRAHAELTRIFRHCFVYRGGHHIAIHTSSGEHRLMIVAE